MMPMFYNFMSLSTTLIVLQSFSKKKKKKKKKTMLIVLPNAKKMWLMRADNVVIATNLEGFKMFMVNHLC